MNELLNKENNIRDVNDFIEFLLESISPKIK